MPENHFSPKMTGKSSDQLKAIIDSKDYSPEARQAATWELEKRGGYDPDTASQIPIPKVSGEEVYKDLLKGVRKKRSWGWTPRYSETLHSDLNTKLTMALMSEAFEKLEWEILYNGPDELIAMRPKKNFMGPEGEKVSVSVIDPTRVKVKSESTGQEIFDAGRNSLRVQLLIHVFNEIKASKTKEDLSTLEADLQRVENWDDYEIPETLPDPPKIREAKPVLFCMSVILSALFLSFVFAMILTKAHLVVLFEGVIGWLLSLVVVKSLKVFNYTNAKTIRITIISAVLIIISGTQYFEYQIILYQNPALGNFLSFQQFLETKFQQGFQLESMNLGWYGWIGLFVLQYIIIYYLNMLRLFTGLTHHVIARVPSEVSEFALYHFVKGKNEQGVRTELSLKGWSQQEHQNYVLEALGAIHESSEFIKHS